MRVLTIPIATAALCGISSIASAQDIYVSATANPLIANGSQGAPFVSIHSAVQAAAPGATIWIGPGTYYQHSITLPRDVVIRGAGKDETILDAANLGRLFYADNQTVVEFSGMTLTNGTSPLGTDGGAIYGDYASALWLKDVRLTNNTAGAEGGAVAMDWTNRIRG